MICPNCGAPMLHKPGTNDYFCALCILNRPPGNPPGPQPNLGPLPAPDPTIEKLQERVAKLESAVADLKRALRGRDVKGPGEGR